LGDAIVHKTPPSGGQNRYNAPTSSQAPSLTQSPSSSLFFNDDEEVDGEDDEDYENLCLYGTISSMYPLILLTCLLLIAL